MYNDPHVTDRHLREFEAHVRSLLFCSYRKNFPKISGTHFTSDAGQLCCFQTSFIMYENDLLLNVCLALLGWGCMLRTGQMMLARTLLALENASGE
jgi:hypothetical protein